VRCITAGVETVLAKIIATFLAIIGAGSAFVAMLSLRRMERKNATVELLKARQEAQAENEENKERLEEEITKANAPLEQLGDSREDRDELAALLDE